MILKSLWFYEHQIKSLKKIKGKFSDHIRRALDEYLQKLESRNVSTSRSEKKKEGESNG